jgi:Cytosine/adenosine deaminases
MINLSEEERWMLYALKEAHKALKIDEVPIGAIIVNKDKIIGRGFNQVESLNDATAHAEMIAITSAANTADDWRLNGCSIYVTKEPCLMCFGAILNARIENLYYGMADSDKGFKELEEVNNLSMSHLNYIEGNILELESKKIIQDFFKKKR